MRNRGQERGAASIYFVAIAGTLLFGFMVFAVDFGRLYLAQGELQTAADSAALAAAKSLVGTANAQILAADQITAALDNTDSNDNRFNLRQNQIGAGATNLSTQVSIDYFSTRADALTPGASGGATGADAKYVRVQITAQVPVLFAQFINASFGPTQTVTAMAVAGISPPVCTACGIDALAIVDPSGTGDPNADPNFGLTPWDFYTLYLTTTQQTAPTGPSCTTSTPNPLDGTDSTVEYAILDHLPTGGAIDPDGTLFELAAAGTEQTDSDTIGGGATVGGFQGTSGPEAAFGTIYNTSLIPTTASPGQDVICGLNTRFGVDPSQATPCDTLAGGEFVLLAPAFSADSDAGLTGPLQVYGTDYAGNGRRVLTVPVVDDPSSLNVLGFRQFLVETDSTAPSGVGLNPSTTGSNCQTGAFPAQYLGWPVPLRCAGTSGSCSVQFGAGRTALH